MAPGPVLRGFSFFPRGGSARVVRYLTEALLEAGWSPRSSAARWVTLAIRAMPQHSSPDSRYRRSISRRPWMPCSAAKIRWTSWCHCMRRTRTRPVLGPHLHGGLA